ncbi:kinase-like domain-containing protein [Aspergillus caelatus]|uniref:Kinase-like domain-containing protein n=1 Tax=Aspergillus caelatus TaxID=61420 RepID=A0A5N7ADT5_9EURO|nr:kinase-like domain-containing protein [Aspergillus caelatus]KAE8367498.1 kinase-like domain-containing protein [Aspergillus caelatus]
MPSRGTHVMKYREGLYNKAFLLMLNDGSEVVARLPNPNAGPPVFTTASEVATMEYVREILGLPGLRVLRWSSDSSNPVGSEYIIMEKAKGIPLGDTWYQLSTLSKHKFMKQVVELETKLAAVPFTEHGCIYYAQNAPRERPKNEYPLYGDDLKKFCIGPVVDPILWYDERTEIELNRGPWHHLSDHATSIGTNERTWAMQYAKPRMNYYRSNTNSEMRDEYIDLIEKYLLVVPHLTQCEPDCADLLQPTSWHNDLHLNNIYVDLNTETITDIIDWQSTTVAPLLLQAKVPRMARHITPLPLGWTLSQKDKLKADRLYESALCHKYHEVCTAKKNPRHYAALSHNDTWKSPLILPMKSISGAWSSREMQPVADYPISFTEEERNLNNEEMENRDYIEGLMEEFQDAGILPSDRIVDPEDYEVVQKTNGAQKEKFMSLAEDEEQREWMDKIWPYQDRPSET